MGTHRLTQIKRIRLTPDTFVWFIFTFLVLFSSISSDIFLTGRNLRNVLLIQPVGLGIAALAQMLIIISGGIDMSIGAAVSLLTTLTAGLYQSMPETNPLIAFCLILLVGLMIGAVNGLFVVYLRIPAFMGTLATSSILQGLIYFYTKRPIGGIPKSFRFIAEGKLLSIPFSFLFFLVIFILLSAILLRNRVGKRFYAVGSNAHVSALSGIPVARVQFLAYLVGGVLVGLASSFLAARMGGGGPTAGSGYELDTITAAVIGGVALSGGYGTPAGVIGGVLTLTIFSNIMNLLDINPYIQMFLKGVILIAAVSFNTKKGVKS